MPGCLFSVDQMTMLYLKAPHPLSPRDSPPSMTGISHLSTGSTSSFNWTVHDIIGDTCTITNSWAGHFGTVHDIMISYEIQSHTGICLPGHFGVIEYFDCDILWLKMKGSHYDTLWTTENIWVAMLLTRAWDNSYFAKIVELTSNITLLQRHTHENEPF